MELNKNGRLFRWAYFWKDPWERDAIRGTTLCAFFWRAFVLMPLFWVLVICIPLAILGALAVEAYNIGFWPSVIIGGAISLIAGGGSLYENRRNLDLARYFEPVAQSVFIQGLKAVKGKVCPLIQFKEGDI